MSLGDIARHVLGPRLFRAAGRVYRGCFVNLEHVVDAIPPLPLEAQILEIGAGHGELTNVLLARYPTVTVTMQELAPRTGFCLRPKFLGRVRLLPATPLDAPVIRDQRYDAILITDVLHHVPLDERETFLRAVAGLVEGRQVTLVFKDLQPIGLRAWLSAAADRYITGDRDVSLVPQAEYEAMVQRALPNAHFERTSLYECDPPNYAFTVRT